MTANGGRCLVPDSSILTGMQNIINEALGLKKERLKYKDKKRCQLWSKPPTPDFSGEELIQKILDQINANWDGRKSRSNNQNWRWKKNPLKKNRNNKSQEVFLERLIVGTTDDDWVNQVPVASGLTRSAGGRRAIDLVHRCGNNWYELIELKVDEGGGTPLFAAMEILQYGVLYIFSRENAQSLGYKETNNELLGASGIHLKVLAPAAYYKKYDLSWLEVRINNGLANFLEEPNRGFKMDFKFESLSLVPSGSRVQWG